MSKKAYTYLVGWSNQDVFYYGFRSYKDCEPNEDLWVKYFTSSVHVKHMRETVGEPDIVIIDRVFNTMKKAKEYETWYLDTVADITSPRWLNKTNGCGKFFHDIPHSDAAKAKMRDAKIGYVPWNKGKSGYKQPPEAVASRAESNRGKKRTPEQIENLKNGQKNRKPFTDEQRKNMSEAQKRRFQNSEHPNKGKVWSDEWHKNLSESLKGRVAWNKGKTGGTSWNLGLNKEQQAEYRAKLNKNNKES